MKSSDIVSMSRLVECLIVKNLPNIRKKLSELKYLHSGMEADKKSVELLDEVNKSIENLQVIKLGIETSGE